MPMGGPSLALSRHQCPIAGAAREARRVLKSDVGDISGALAFGLALRP